MPQKSIIGIQFEEKQLLAQVVADRGLYCQREIGALHGQTH
jgi:hypothetical protein